jgi:hypothetical protein
MSSRTTPIKSSKPHSVEALPTGYFRVGRGTSSIVRTLTAAQLAEWEATDLNWTSFRPTPAAR